MNLKKQEILRCQDPTGSYDLVISHCPKGVWTVVYQGQPFQIRKEHHLTDQKKYLTTTWSQRGGAERLAQYLNRVFDTHSFEVAEIQGKTPD